MKKVLISLGFAALALGANAQVKIKDGSVTGSSTTPNSNAILELESNNKGLIYPRVGLTSTSSASPLTAHVKGMVVYDTATVAASGITPGLYYNDGTQWVRVAQGSNPDWLIFGNANAAVNGTPAGNTDSQYITGRVAIGTNTAATVASAISGSSAAQQTAMLTVAGGDASINNITVGLGGGQQSTNTALGLQALYNNTTGYNNVAIGSQALTPITTGHDNTGIGYQAGGLSTGIYNTFVGSSAGGNNNGISGSYSTIIGAKALNNNYGVTDEFDPNGTGTTLGDGNTVVGYGVFAATFGVSPSSIGYGNTVLGTGAAVIQGSMGNSNIVIGDTAVYLVSNMGNNNVIIGAITNGANNAYSYEGIGSNNIIIGANQINPGIGDNLLNIGGAILGMNMTGIPYNVNTGTGTSPAGNIGIAVLPNASYALAVGSAGAINNSGNANWAIPSDRRIKTDIETFTDGLNVITQLKPVTFRYNAKSGNTDLQAKHIGFIAQDVEKVAPYMVKAIDDSKGASKLSDKRVLDVSALNQILVNAIQEQQKEIEQLKKEIEALKK